MSLTTIRTRYDNTKCRLCKTVIPYNGLCRYSNRIKGVACMECEPERTARTTPANGAPVAGLTEMAQTLAAALSDGQALRTRIGEMEARIVELTGDCHARGEWLIEATRTITTLRDKLKMSEEVRLAQAAHLIALTAPPTAIDDTAEKAMKTRQSIPVIADDDCPI